MNLVQWAAITKVAFFVTLFALSWAIVTPWYPGYTVFLALGGVPLVYGVYRIHQIKQERRSEVVA